MKCLLCGCSFASTPFNVNYCDNCSTDLPREDSEVDVECRILQNPSGKTRPVFIESYDRSFDDTDADSI
jgi:hypothetical protein